MASNEPNLLNKDHASNNDLTRGAGSAFKECALDGNNGYIGNIDEPAADFLKTKFTLVRVWIEVSWP